MTAEPANNGLSRFNGFTISPKEYRNSPMTTEPAIIKFNTFQDSMNISHRGKPVYYSLQQTQAYVLQGNYGAKEIM